MAQKNALIDRIYDEYFNCIGLCKQITELIGSLSRNVKYLENKGIVGHEGIESVKEKINAFEVMKNDIYLPRGEMYLAFIKSLEAEQKHLLETFKDSEFVLDLDDDIDFDVIEYDLYQARDEIYYIANTRLRELSAEDEI